MIGKCNDGWALLGIPKRPENSIGRYLSAMAFEVESICGIQGIS